MPIANHVTF